MALWSFILCIVFSLNSTDGGVDIDRFGNPLFLPQGRLNRPPIVGDRPISLASMEIDDNRPASQPAVKTPPPTEAPSPATGKKSESETGRQDRRAPLKPARPSEEIKADQAVDFPYDI